MFLSVEKEKSRRILVIGMSAGGAASLAPVLLERIMAADLLVGGRRHLGYFPGFSSEREVIGADIDVVVKRLQQSLAQDKQAVVLASGDPLCYGIGASLRSYFPAEALEIIPTATAFQLAFAALAEPWPEAALLSAHARPLADVVAGTLAAAKAAILTDNHHTPAVIAEALLQAGLASGTSCAICENLGSAEQRIVRTQLGQVGQEDYAPLNVFVVWPQKSQDDTEAARTQQRIAERNEFCHPIITYPAKPSHRLAQQNSVSPPNLLIPQGRFAVSQSPHPPGLPDDAFSTSAGQITKREIRLLSLAELALQPQEVMWDIGAGSGAVGLEAARAQPEAVVYAIEKRPEMRRHIDENLRRFPAPNFHPTTGQAPEDIESWPDPHAVFIGGSGGQLEAIVVLVRRRLQPGGRLVINLATLENLYTIHRSLPEAQVSQLQINRGAPILNMLRFEALNPVFMVTWMNKR